MDRTPNRIGLNSLLTVSILRTKNEKSMADTESRLTPEAEAYFKQLPSEDFPAQLIETYPRIANRIVALRSDEPALGKYFESLLADERGGRQGFPFPILVEIQNLFDSMIGIPGGFTDTNSLLASQLNK